MDSEAFNPKPKNLNDIYKELKGDQPITLFTAPPIRFAYKKSDYLYLLYRNLFDSKSIKITGISTLGHIKPVIWQLFRKPTVLHYHWLEFTGITSAIPYFFKVICIFLYSLLGGSVVWSVHNKLPLDCRYEWLNYKIRKWLAHRADLLIAECESVIDDISTFFSVHVKKIRVWPHPEYPPQLMPRAAAVEAINHRYNVHLKVQDRLFLMFGHISAYKQIDKVCEIFLNEPIQKKLIIVGPVKNGQMKLYKTIKKIAARRENIVLIPQFIKEECVPEFMNAADYVLFNYRDVLSSGGVPLAESYNKPIILPRTGCLKERSGENLRFFNTQNELAELIRNL